MIPQVVATNPSENTNQTVDNNAQMQPPVTSENNATTGDDPMSGD